MVTYLLLFQELYAWVGVEVLQRPEGNVGGCPFRSREALPPAATSPLENHLLRKRQATSEGCPGFAAESMARLRREMKEIKGLREGGDGTEVAIN